MIEQTGLVQWDSIKTAIANCKDIITMGKLNYSLEAVQQWAKQSKQSLETQNEIAEYRLRLNRKQGEWIELNIPGKGTQCLGDLIKLPEITLTQVGIDRNDSPKFRALATIPEDKFEQFIAETKAAADELTSVAAVRIAQKIKRESQQESAPPLPDGVFDVIYADPPWQYDNQIESWGPTSLHYPTMPLEDIMNIEVPAADNAVLFLWATNPFLEDALKVVEAWDFTYKTNIVWVKTELQRPGSGFYVRGRHELLFICTRGAFVPDQTGKEPIGSVLEAPVREHSQKPAEIYGLIESMYPQSKYLELFARIKRERWESWGNEVSDKH